MKKSVITIFCALVFGIFLTGEANAQSRMVLRPGQQGMVSGLRIKFLSVVEDSRCPENARCVWAGNAKIRVQVTIKRFGTRIFEMNTFSGPKGNQIDGYSINLENLTPGRRTSDPIRPNRYRATISVSRLRR